MTCKGFYKPVCKVHKKTREIIAQYPSAKQAAIENSLNINTMNHACLRRSLNSDEHYYRYLCDFDPNENFFGKKGCPVVVVNTLTLKAYWFSSVNECMKQMNLTRKQINKALNEKKPRGNLHFYYVGIPSILNNCCNIFELEQYKPEQDS